MGIKLVHLITDLDVGGAEMMLCKLLCGMDRSRYRNVVIAMTGHGVLEEKIKSLGVPVFNLGLRSGISSGRGFWRLLHLLRREQPQILQTWLYHADLLGLLAGKWARVPAIAWNVRCSDVDWRQYSKLSALLIRVLARLSAYPDVLVVNSAAGQKRHEAVGYHPRRWQLIPNGFDLDQFRPDASARRRLRQELGVLPETVLIGLIARFDPMKDHDNFFRAARLLIPRHADVRFILAGRSVDSSNDPLVRSLRVLGIAPYVHLLGERRDMSDLMAALDIVSSSSYGEGFPNVIGEAMACGVPCVVTDVGDCKRIVGDTGRVVPAKDPQALAEAWRALIAAGPAGRSHLGSAARRRIAERFSLSAIVAQYEALYATLIDDKERTTSLS